MSFSRSLLLGKRPLDTDNEKGFHKWPFMTTHAWSEHARGTWKLELFFDNQDEADNGEETTGEFLEWVLLLHGTKEAPYVDQTPLNERTKLAVAKKIHENDFIDNERFVDLLKQDHQKRLGDDLSM